MMKSTGVASGGIVHQALTKDNYERWSRVMQNYLQGQGLWDVVIKNVDANNTDFQASKNMKDVKAFHIFQLSLGRELHETLKSHFNNQNGESIATQDLEQGLLGVVQTVSEVEIEASWNTKDAKALHIIQLSCGREIFDEISRIKTAREVWNYLSSQYGKELKASPDTEQAASYDSLGKQQKELFRSVERGDYIGNAIMDSDVCMTSGTRRTLLHVAVIAGNMENVKVLVKKGSDRLLLMQDKHGDTALSLVARYTGNTDMAKCMVETKNETFKKLLTMENKDKVTPILLAAANGHKKLTAYLYSETSPKVFDDDSQNRVLLLSLCITAEIFDVALRLLKRYKELPKESLSLYRIHVPKMLWGSLSLSNDSHQQSLSDKFSALVALAKMPSAFPSGTKFSRREQFIYDILSVESKFRQEYDIPDMANFVKKVTRITVDDERPPKTSSGWHFCKQLVSIFLVWPVKLLGLLLHWIIHGIPYLFIQSFNRLNIFGVRRIYELKYTHYEVIGILGYFCQSIVEFNSLQLKNASAHEGMLHAAQHGIIEFIIAMKEANHDLLSAIDCCNRGIFSHAILYRKENVFQLIHCLNRRSEIFRNHIDIFGNNLLHLAAQLGPSSDRDSRSGAALQMQREIKWFKAVEKIVHPKLKEAKNGDGKKPFEIFTENHDELVKLGEKWAKDTATSFTIVGTLITTIMFTAAFTVPGGNNQDTGLPIFLNDSVFTTFLMADALSLFTSATSVLIFIGILTSRYAEKDFLKSLPRKLLFALSFLFLSVCSMIVAFCAAIAMILKGYRTYKWFIVGSTMSLGSIPIMVLVLSQLRLMNEILRSTWKNTIGNVKL